MSLRARVYEAIRKDCRTFDELALRFNAGRNSIVAACRDLVKEGAIKREYGTGNKPVFTAVEGRPPKARQRDFTDLQERYDALRVTRGPRWVAEAMNLSDNQADNLERSYAQIKSTAGDITVPKFARHEDHVAVVMEVTGRKGFCALSEKRGARGHAATHLPLIWTARAAA